MTNEANDLSACVDTSAPTKALESGLLLALTAPSEKDFERVMALVEDLAIHLTPDEIETAKGAALAAYHATEQPKTGA